MKLLKIKGKEGIKISQGNIIASKNWDLEFLERQDRTVLLEFPLSPTFQKVIIKSCC